MGHAGNRDRQLRSIKFQRYSILTLFINIICSFTTVTEVPEGIVSVTFIELEFIVNVIYDIPLFPINLVIWHCI